MWLRLVVIRSSGNLVKSPHGVRKIHLKWLWPHCKDTIPKIRNKYSQKRNCTATVPILTFMFLWEIYKFPWSVCLFCCRKCVDRSWEYIDRSQKHDVEIGTQAAQFLFWEYINRNFFAVHVKVILKAINGIKCFLLILWWSSFKIWCISTDGNKSTVLSTPDAKKLANTFKGTVSRDFLLLVFFMNQFPPSPWVYH